jgi:GT2 family glycosyltransferase
MQVSIIIVNFNTFELTSKCIQSIYDKIEDLAFEIILVDNASHECDPEKFKENLKVLIKIFSLEQKTS